MWGTLALLNLLGLIGGGSTLYYQYADELDDQTLTEQERFEYEREFGGQNNTKNLISSLGFLGIIILFLFLNEKRK